MRRDGSEIALSIVICTFNRAESLARTLRTLADQPSEALGQAELLVVDNNSTDATREVVAGFRAGFPVRYLEEPRQGQAFARNLGVAEARGELVVFIDDDVRLHGDWLPAYLRAARDHPDACYFGGRILPDWQAMARPSWLKDEAMPLLRGVILFNDLGETTRAYDPAREGPYGASFGFRRSLVEEIGAFNTDLGPNADFPGRADDTEFIARAVAHGCAGVYVGEALCWHWVHPARLTLAGLYRHGLAKGAAHRVLDGTAKGSRAAAAGYLARGLYQLAKGRGDRFRQCVINVGMQMGMR